MKWWISGACVLLAALALLLYAEARKKKPSLRFLTESAVIAAIYVTLTVLLAPLSYGVMQIRISEALTVLPFFTPTAVPGLFIGCAIANLVGGNGIADIVFGSVATLLAAFLTRKIKNQWLAPLPPVLINAVVVGAMLSAVLSLPFWSTALLVGAGQAIACYGVGLQLLLLLKKYGAGLFGQGEKK